MIEVFEIRKALDVLAMELFLKSPDLKVIRTMRKTVDDMELHLKNEEYAKFVQCDGQFHDLLFNNTGNRRLERILSELSDQEQRILSFTVNDATRCRRSYEDHLAIIGAVEKGDSERALELLRNHIVGSLAYHTRKMARI